MARGLESAHAKIVRAMKQREAIEDCIAEYSKKKPYRKVEQPDGGVSLEITQEPPIDLSVMAGEIIYQLRSALDHMFFDLAERHWSGAIPDDIANRLYFPLCLKPPGDATRVPPIPRSSFGEAIIPACIPDEAFTIIECLQPYYRRHHGHRLLKMLRIFGNIDKHRHLNATAAAIDRRHTVSFPGGLSSTFIMPWLRDGAELYEPRHEVDHLDKSAMEVTDEYKVVIAFDEPEFGPLQTAPLDDVIYDLPTFIFNASLYLKKFLV
jgi:hypothetical protein